ncbi:MAG: response regulator [Anaerolineaceae bacterium]|nr:MAG: response regulator [Anaerolineaceae bacterium]
MNKLLIVEDEKMIRHGIQAMVMRSSVNVDEIILCKNGEEAYDVVKNQKIDVMITDIRMPKKDGITLVKEIQALEHVPKVVVVSGYEDFSYAVDLLRCGAKEYILKPIDRDKINEILVKLEKEIKAEQNQLMDKKHTDYRQLKYILLNENIAGEEIRDIANNFELSFLDDEYIVCCTNMKRMEDTLDEVIYLEDICSQSVFIIKADMKEEIRSNLLKSNYVGVSKPHRTLKELVQAYREALYARKKSFALENSFMEYSHLVEEYETISEEMIDQFVQLIGTNNIVKAYRFINHLIYKTKLGQIAPDHLEEVMYSTIDKICETYKNFIAFDYEIADDLKNIYQHDTAGNYYEAVFNWIEKINNEIVAEYDDYKNKQKIKRAIIYIQQNYNKNLNMAVVSNYVSMNYSLFSYIFKQYTDMNFVNYLKALRINEAKRLLEETDNKIYEISTLVGYENEKNFMKVFRKVCGVSPSEYRRNIQVGKSDPMS